MNKRNKLALGTAQFGIPYGISNPTGQIPLREVQKILRTAYRFGVDTLDTAIAYGESEKVIGDHGVFSWKIITKIPVIPNDITDIEQWIKFQINQSLRKLKVGRLYGVLLHQPNQIIEKRGISIYESLNNLKASGLVEKIGLSIYNPETLDKILHRYKFDLVQAPISILDRRLIETGWAKKLKDNAIEIHARSAFLQGLLLMPPSKRPPKFSRWTEIWQEWDRWLEETGLTPLEACLRYLYAQTLIDKIVVGVDSVVHLNQLLDVAEDNLRSLPQFKILEDDRLINPSTWNQI